MGDARPSAVPPWIHQVFPSRGVIQWRPGGDLSSRRKHQLSISRALAGNPKLLILDEPTQGFRPLIAKEIVRTHNRLQAEHGIAMLLSEQKLSSSALKIADHFLIIERGEFVHEARHAEVDAASSQAFFTI